MKKVLIVIITSIVFLGIVFINNIVVRLPISIITKTEILIHLHSEKFNELFEYLESREFKHVRVVRSMEYIPPIRIEQNEDNVIPEPNDEDVRFLKSIMGEIGLEALLASKGEEYWSIELGNEEFEIYPNLNVLVALTRRAKLNGEICDFQNQDLDTPGICYENLFDDWYVRKFWTKLSYEI